MEEFDSTEPAGEWERVSPVLDQALNELSETDRHAIVWRFFEGRPLSRRSVSDSGLVRAGLRAVFPLLLRSFGQFWLETA